MMISVLRPILKPFLNKSHQTYQSNSNQVYIFARKLSLVPIVIEQSGRGERSYDIYSRLLKDRIICLMGPINEVMSSLLVAQLLFLQSQSSIQPIHMYINSPGGSVTAGLGIYDTMQYIHPPIATWCVGQACSMASLLLCSGAPGLRHSLPNSRIMIHQPSGGVQGQATDIQIQAEEILKLKFQINELYVKHTGKPLEKIAQSMERDCFMSPAEAVTYGLIDKVLLSPPKAPKPTGASIRTEDKDKTKQTTPKSNQVPSLDNLTIKGATDGDNLV